MIGLRQRPQDVVGRGESTADGYFAAGFPGC
jgi:hypothetical protein